MKRFASSGSIWLRPALCLFCAVLAAALLTLSSCNVAKPDTSGEQSAPVSVSESPSQSSADAAVSGSGDSADSSEIYSEEGDASDDSSTPEENSHVHAFEDETVDPTCLNAGYVIQRCACGEKRIIEGEPALGHDFRETVTEAGCETEGRIERVCARCGLKETETLPAMGHSYAYYFHEFKQTADGYHFSEYADCTRCGEKDVPVRDLTISTAIAEDKDAPAPDIPGEGGTLVADLQDDGRIRVRAVPKDYYDFIGWSDGKKGRERLYDGSDPLTAYFAYRTTVMPVLRIDTENAEMITHRDYYLRCTVSVSGCEEKFRMSGVEAGIRVRGNASSNYGDPEYAKDHKVHYRIKFDKKQGMLGLNSDAKCKSWVLLRGDTTFVREPISFKLFTDITRGAYYSSDYTFVQVYINGEYYGAYVLCEQTQIQKNRIAIPELKDGETELRTGYLIEIDNYTSLEPVKFHSNLGGRTLTDMYGVSKVIHNAGYSIKYDSLTDEQLQFVKRFVVNVYEIIYQAIYKNHFCTLDANNRIIEDKESKTAKECISKVLDLDAAVAMYITREICAERDGGVGSFFMYVDFTDPQPRLTFCAPWDFSWAYATTNGFSIDHFWVSAFQPEEFAYAGDRSFSWFITLYKGEFFQDMVKETWQDMHARGVQQGILDEIRRISKTYENEFEMNRKRWDSGNQASGAEKIRKFLSDRMDWLDTQWNG
ncbi:MAG: CotH kinase family protein [Clostridia bacterium]|nr:CotH kinase family protein [Clostridia bacterium]